MRRVSNNIGVFVCLKKAIEDSYVFLIGVNGLAIVDDLPELDAPFRALPLFFHESLFVGASTSEFIIEGVKVDGENAVLGAVPAHFG
jgi:hypothetical protein